MPTAFDGQRAYELVRHLASDIGARVMGSDAEKRACAEVRAYFERLGLSTTEQEFEVETGEHLGHKVEALDPSPREIRCFPNLLTPDTPSEGLVGDLVYVDGDKAPAMGPHLKGKIALWAPSPTNYGSEILRFEPAAVVRVCQTVGIAPKQYEMSQGSTRPWERVPWFETTYEEALRLVREGTQRVRLRKTSVCRPSTCSNVIAELKGTASPEDIIVLGGHIDTVPNLPGATDNASGCAVVMELARLFAERGGAKRTLRFAAWGAEEGGLRGSREYVRRLVVKDKAERAAEGFVKGRNRTELDRHLLSVCVDVVGMTVGYSKCFVFGPTELRSTMAVLADELGTAHEISDGDYGSDYIPFAAAGIPSVAPARMGGAALYMHTPKDDLDLIDPDHLAEVGRYVDAFLERAANAHVWPYKREVPDAVRARMKEYLVRGGEAEAEDWARLGTTRS